MTSPRFEVETDSIWVRVLGVDGARIRYSMRGYPIVIGNQNAPIYKSHHMVSDAPTWMLWDKMDYWRGDRAYLEIATAGDLPTGVKGYAREEKTRSWFGIQEVVMQGPGQEPKTEHPDEVK